MVDTPRVRVGVADDHPVYRDGLRAMLESLPEVELVGEAGDTDAAVELVAGQAPDVLLLDLEMPGGGGLEVLRRIGAALRPPATLVLTMHEDDGSVVAAIRAGARGYLHKGADRNELSRAIATCAAGGVVFGARLSSQVAALLDRSDDLAARAFPELTPRERDVLERMARAEDNFTIAQGLGLSSKTVRNLVSTILNKLGARDRAAAMLIARDAGLGERRSGAK
jgi:DNA-binding NarL/FixJ family response regulator